MDAVNHPSHYNSGQIEVIDYIIDQFGEEGSKTFCLANAIKYISRCGKKDKDKAQEDIKKAIWYLNKYLEIGTDTITIRGGLANKTITKENNNE